MSSTPIPDNLTVVLERLAARLESLEARLERLEGPADPTIAATYAQETAKVPPFREAPPTKGKGRAKATRAPSKAQPAKKARTTGKTAKLPNPVPLPLAQTFPMEGKTDRHLVTVVIPDTSAQHVIGEGGKGLKQIHDISGARINAYSLGGGSNDERHVSIRGTDLQIGDALVVLGKRLARKKVRVPKAKKTVPTKASSKSAPLHTTDQLSSALRPLSTTQRQGPPTQPRIVEVPMGEHEESSSTPIAPTVEMASPSPISTPIVPSVAMGSPTSYRSPGTLTPMDISAIFAQAGRRHPPTDPQQRLSEALDLVSQGYAALPSGSGCGNTARRSRPGPPGSRGRG